MRKYTLLFLILSIFLMPLVLTGESLWTDEGWAGTFGLEPDFASWYASLKQDMSADSQMPLHLFLTWLLAKVLGTSEWQLRAGNLLWGAVALAGSAYAGRKIRIPWLPLLVILQPFFCFYLNEARPYVLQMAIGWWLLAGFVTFHQEKGQGLAWAIILASAGLVLCHATMLAPASLLPMALVTLFLGMHHGWRVDKRVWFIFAAAALLTLPIGLYYLGTLARGAKGAQLWQVDGKFLAFVFYEYIGLMGLGPPVLKLRELVQSAPGALLAHSYRFIAPALCAIALATLAFSGWRGRRRDPENSTLLPALIAVFSLVVGIFVIAALAAHKAFWARHFSGVFPFYVTSLALLTRAAFHALPRVWFSATAGCIVSLYILSSATLRLSPEYRKEDYRAAAEFAKRMLLNEKSVWWVAAHETAHYYHLPLVFGRPQPRLAFFYQSRAGLEPAPTPPDVLVVTRIESFDVDGGVRQLLAAGHYRQVGTVTGFRFFQKNDSSPNP